LLDPGWPIRTLVFKYCGYVLLFLSAALHCQGADTEVGCHFFFQLLPTEVISKGFKETVLVFFPFWEPGI